MKYGGEVLKYGGKALKYMYQYVGRARDPWLTKFGIIRGRTVLIWKRPVASRPVEKDTSIQLGTSSAHTHYIKALSLVRRRRSLLGADGCLTLGRLNKVVLRNTRICEMINSE